jgi:hypothetical protein
MRHSLSLAWLGLALVAGVLGTTPVRAQDTHVITKLDDITNGRNNACWSLVSAADSGAKRFRCPGFANWRVEMVSSGPRTYVMLGRPATDAKPAAQLIAASAIEPGHSIEWHLRNGQPVAASHLYLYESAIGLSEAMVVYKLDANQTACIAAVIAGDNGRDLEAEADRLATKVVPTFQCGKDQPVTLGKRLAAMR